MRTFLLLAFLIIYFRSGAQLASPAVQYASTIKGEDIKKHVYALASAAYQGRETGTEGNRKAAEYIIEQFKSMDLPVVPGDTNYSQEVDFTSVKWKEIKMIMDGQPVEHLRDFLSIPQFFSLTDDTIRISSLTFVGYGIDDPAYSDFKGKKLTGQHLLAFSGEPRDRYGNSRITGTDSLSAWSVNPLMKLEAARKAGAASIMVIDDRLRDQVMYARRYLLTGAMLMGSPEQLTEDALPHAMISPALGERVTGNKRAKVIKLRNRITAKGKPGSVVIPADIKWVASHQISTTEGMNVLGYIEGSDPVLKNELIVITAHYDHLGMRGNDIYFGADDNASGTSAVLEIAEAMAKAKTEANGPARSVLCMLVTGEEKGLLGSKYYVEHPVFPLENTVANVNIDMIGRIDTFHRDANYTYVIGSDRLSTQLHDINESVNKRYTQLALDYTYNREDDPNQFYYRSDHYNFAKHGIPAIFYFSGVHEDYHRPTDTPDKIMYEKAARIAQLAFHTAWELANRKERIKVDVVGRN